jgi:hypothetical protein
VQYVRRFYPTSGGEDELWMECRRERSTAGIGMGLTMRMLWLNANTGVKVLLIVRCLFRKVSSILMLPIIKEKLIQCTVWGIRTESKTIVFAATFQTPPQRSQYQSQYPVEK